ncbi:MAG: hypothetical protein JWM11_3318 [Planctomycetaceae bacterium]|nr:hypothetical protein [Planctomycetaceae bacterium]
MKSDVFKVETETIGLSRIEMSLTVGPARQAGLSASAEPRPDCVEMAAALSRIRVEIEACDVCFGVGL